MKFQFSFIFAIVLSAAFLSGCVTNSPLLTATSGGNKAEFRELLNKGADINERSGLDDLTPLMASARQGNLDMVRELLKSGANVKIKNKYDDTALTWAAKKCHQTIVQVLIDNGADVNAQNIGYWSTPLMLAASCNDVVNVKALLAKGANRHAKNRSGMTALTAAIEKGNLETVKTLLEAGMSVIGPEGSVGLHYAAAKGDDPMTKFLIEKGVDVNIRSEAGRTPLMNAVVEGHSTTVSILLKMGANVNASNERGQTALMFAARYGSTDITKQLLEHDAHVDVLSIVRDSALIEAAQRGYYDIVSLLLKHGANANIADINGKTALAYAVDRRYEEIAKVLRNAGAMK